MKKSKNNNPYSRILVIASLIFFYVPIVYVCFFSFNSSRSLTHFTGLSLQWYEAMFTNRTIMEALWVTIYVAIIATLISTIVGTLTAIGLSRSRKIVREVVEQINNLPMMMPEIVIAISLMLFFIGLNIKLGMATLIISHIVFCIPYVLISVMPKLRQLDPNLAEAAMDLGATPFQALYKVIIPQIVPGIISGALIAFTMSFDDFVISFFNTGEGINNISIYVYAMYKRINPSINALSALIVLFVSLVLVGMHVVPRIMERKNHKHEKKGKPNDEEMECLLP